MRRASFKLLVIDIDGTILGKSGTISPETQAALSRVRQSGIGVRLATGRVPQACHKVIQQLDLNGCHIFFDGAVIIDPCQKQPVYAQPLAPDLVEEAIEYCHTQHIDLDFYSIGQYFTEEDNWATEIRRNFFKIKPTIINFKGLSLREPMIKGTLAVASIEEKELAQRFQRHFQGRLSFSRTTTPSYPGIDFINVLDTRVSKGQALNVLTTHLGIPLSEVAAIGDGNNDISMFQDVGMAIAMQDASTEVKIAAHQVTLGVEDNGVSAAIDRFLL
jgi:Cof subfamily protein (haloacid dehalogenase superfamily)